MTSPVVGYKNVTQAAAVTVKTGPARLYGFTCTASSSGTITVYDNTAASGTVLFTDATLTVGETVTFPFGIAAGTGLHVVCGGTATVNGFYV